MAASDNVASSDNPTLVLVKPLLEGIDNYNHWKRSMTKMLSSRGKLGYVDGSIHTLEPNDEGYGAWMQLNDLVHNWLVNSMIPSVAASVMYFDTAREIWLDLQDRFGRQNAYRLSNLEEEIEKTKQGNLTVTEYYTKLKTLWDQYLILRPIPPCTCPALHIMREYYDNAYTTRFLKGLNGNFSTVKSQVLMTMPLPNIKTAFVMALNHEQQLDYNSANAESMIMASSSAAPNTNQGNNIFGNQECNAVGTQARYQAPGQYKNMNYPSKRPVCTYCGKEGHTIDKCYKKYGFPPSFKNNRGGTHTAHNVTTDQDMDDDQGMQESANSESGQITQNQYEHLLSLIQGLKSAPAQCNSVVLSAGPKPTQKQVVFYFQSQASSCASNKYKETELKKMSSEFGITMKEPGEVFDQNHYGQLKACIPKDQTNQVCWKSVLNLTKLATNHNYSMRHIHQGIVTMMSLNHDFSNFMFGLKPDQRGRRQINVLKELAEEEEEDVTMQCHSSKRARDDSSTCGVSIAVNNVHGDVHRRNQLHECCKQVQDLPELSEDDQLEALEYFQKNELACMAFLACGPNLKLKYLSRFVLETVPATPPPTPTQKLHN